MGDFAGDSIPNYVQSLWDKLKELNCPVIKSFEPWNGVEALLKPGDIRLKFLQWIIAGIDENAADSLDAIGLRNDNKDLKATKILSIFSKMKLCAPDDTALILGRVSKPQQLAFLNFLLKILMARKRVDDENMQDTNVSDTSSISSDATFVMNTSSVFTRNYCRHTQFIDNLANRRLIHVFQERVLRVPRDIELELEQQGITQPEGHKKLSVVMQVELLKKKLQSLEWDFFHQEEFLLKLSEKVNAVEESMVIAALDKLTATVEDILLMEDEFNRVFTDQLSSSCWKKINQQQISSLGDEMSQLYSLTEEVEKIFTAAKELRKSNEVFQTSLKDSVKELSEESSKTQKMCKIEDWLLVLRESISNLSEKCYNYNVARNIVDQGFSCV